MKSPLVLLTLLFVLAGCARQEPVAVASGHQHRAPHGGVLVELGQHQHNLELLFDPTQGVLQIWVLDGHAENFVRINQPGFEGEARVGATLHRLSFTAVANAMTGETVGDSASFAAPAEWLRTTKAFDGRIKELTVQGNIYRDLTFHYDAHETHAP